MLELVTGCFFNFGEESADSFQQTKRCSVAQSRLMTHGYLPKGIAQKDAAHGARAINTD